LAFLDSLMKDFGSDIGNLNRNPAMGLYISPPRPQASLPAP
jgi:hypothetical protein